jgi:hypothetical protein
MIESIDYLKMYYENQNLMAQGYYYFLTMLGLGIMFYLIFVGGAYFLKTCFNLPGWKDRPPEPPRRQLERVILK